jgi:tetratricopeptide (TPR) repeat protein
MIFTLLFFFQSLSEQGVQAMKEHRFEDAERIYRQLVKQEPNELRLRMNLGLALFSGAKYSEAAVEFEKFLKAVPAPGPAHLLLGVSRLKLRKPCEAIPALESARKWQASPQVLLELGDSYFGCKRYEQAAMVFASLGETPKGLQGTGLSYARLGKQQEASAAFAKLEKLPPSAELHELLAEVRALESRHEDAVKELAEAVRLSPRDERLQRLYARSLWRAGQYHEARKLYGALAVRWSDDPEFNYEYGDTLVRVEGVEAGLALLEKAVKTAPELIAARGALGKALLQVGRAKESIPHLDAAAQQDPTVLLPLSRAYKATGRPQEAARIEAEYKQRVSEPQN